MKLHQNRDAGNTFVGYGSDYVKVNEEDIRTSVAVTADTVDVDWPATDFDTLTAEHFEYLLRFEPEVVLLGTGERIRFPHPRLFKSLAERGVGVDALDTGALCRTFNILMAEGRRVVAAVLLK